MPAAPVSVAVAPTSAPALALANMANALSAAMQGLTSIDDVNRFALKLRGAIQQSEAEMKAAKEREDEEKLKRAVLVYRIQTGALAKLRDKHQTLVQAIRQGQQLAQGAGSQPVRGPPQNPVVVEPSSAGGFKPNTPGNHPTGPQFGSPNMSVASSIDMNQASSSMNPMVSARIQAQAQQVLQAQAQAQAQGQGPAPAQGGEAGPMPPRMGPLPGQPQPPVSPEMERQYLEVLD